MLAFLKIIVTRAFVVYLAFFWLVWHILDYPKFLANAVPQTMSRLTPPMDYFAEFVDREDSYDRFKLMNCINYHRAVVEFFPYQKAEAYGMLGFCQERLGQETQAIASYKQAISVNSDYFWPYYDLGVIYYNQGQYAKAVEYFQQANAQDPVKTIVLLSRSKVYNDVKLSQQKGEYDYIQGLKQGHLQAYVLMMDSLSRLRQGGDIPKGSSKPRVQYF